MPGNHDLNNNILVDMDAQEKISLAPYAATVACMRGRIHPENKPDYRNEFQRDRDRIIHSSAFRRLEYKTQVFVNHEGDLFRTRLTHSLEVGQIARSIARVLHLNEDLVEAIALAHDLGHTPFGHAGQEALNQCMREFGGFEHNLQSLRVVDILEERYAEFDGLNLCFETREGILKHCSKTHAQKLGDVAKRFIDGSQPSLEAQLANLSDEIAYNNHDVDDGLRSGLLKFSQLLEIELFEREYARIKQKYPSLQERRCTHEIIRRMINAQIIDLIETSQNNIYTLNPQTIDEVRSFKKPLISFSTEMQSSIHQLKKFLRENLYRHYRVHRMSVKAKLIIIRIFEAYIDDPRLMPETYFQRIKTHGHAPAAKAQIIADYIAGMTDRYAIDENERLFNPKTTF